MKRTRIILMAALMGFALAGCDASTQEDTQEYILPKDLADKGCKIYNMQGRNGVTLNVVYCPEAQVTTSYHANKQTHNTTSVDEGKHYGY